MGYTQSCGVGMGDTGGYPERKFKLIETESELEKMIKEYPDRAFYKIVSINKIEPTQTEERPPIIIH
jgi:hypothetical protein